ncbi:MAG: dehydrogenase [Chitinophagaceae bacterium]|nr:MAG: dehydrogenase [Chitinophagaceae bacterium]
MKVRSKVPLRLGLAGGGTDVSPYCDVYGGCILNATIDLFAYCTFVPTTNGTITFHALDRDEIFEAPVSDHLITDGLLDLHKGVYNRVIKEFKIEPFAFDMKTHSDAPSGSGLGSSSTMVVSILQAFVEYLNLPLGEYDIAQLAYSIEREDLALSGGKQDQYAATFGGFNFMEFYAENRVIVNPLRIREQHVEELEASMMLYYTGMSRSSAKIIEDQKNSLQSSNENRLKAMHQIKNDAYLLKEYLLKGEFNKMFLAMQDSWAAKKNTSDSISNPHIDAIYNTALNTGAYSGKISGAGGGGFMMFFVDPLKRINIKQALSSFEGEFVNFHFFNKGANSWKIL